MTDNFEGYDDPIAHEANRLLQSRSFVKSATLSNLLAYLVRCTLEQHVPKEITIGVEVFKKDATYDPANDSVVRVYVHKLRKKIEAAYQSGEIESDKHLSIPKGSYLVTIENKDESKYSSTSGMFRTLKLHSKRSIAALVFAALFLVSTGFHLVNYANQPKLSEGAKELWSGFADNGRKTYVVLGDLYLFHLYDEISGQRFTARTPSMNDDQDFRDFQNQFPEIAGKISSTTNRFLLQSSAYSLTKVAQVLERNSVDYTITTLSDLDPKVLPEANFIYLGMYKSMGLLKRYFERSNYSCVNECLLTIVDRNNISYETTGAKQSEHIDFGLVAKLVAENNNHALFLAGFSDAGLLQAVRAVTYEQDMAIMESTLNDQSISMNESFDVLFEVNGFDYSDYKSRIAQAASITEK